MAKKILYWLEHALVAWALLTLIPPPFIEVFIASILSAIFEVSLGSAFILQYVLAGIVLVLFAPRRLKVISAAILLIFGPRIIKKWFRWLHNFWGRG